MPVSGGLANLGWLEQHISYMKRSFDFNGANSEMDFIASLACDPPSHAALVINIFPILAQISRLAGYCREATGTTDTTIWKPKIRNCSMNRIELCLRCRRLVWYDKYDRYNYM